MSLAQYIQVNTSYTRSINIERDLESAEGGRPYIPTARSIQTISRIAETLHDGTAPRAWALIGPYGSGKSAFGLFLSNLLSSSEWAPANHARTVLKKADAKLCRRISKSIGDSTGYCLITITGSPEPLTRRLAVAMLSAAEEFRGTTRGKVPGFIHELRDALVDEGEVSVGKLIEWLSSLQKMVLRSDGKGVLIVIDELGKFLEYEARHRQSTDIYLLQALAEYACAASEAPVLLVVLLHQAFEQYFASLGDQLKNEWKKVQGRFESIPYLESAEQVLRVVRAAIKSALPESAQRAIQAKTNQIAEYLKAANALPTGLESNNAAEIFVGSYPLHPVSLLLLPSLCQKVAQNERTLFSFLGSAEPHGFQDALTRVTLDEYQPKWILPWEVYEYFILNQPGLVTDQLTHRRWAEVITAVERLGDAPDSAIRLLKTIGLLNIAGSQGGLKASDELLKLVCDAEGCDFSATTKLLLERSVVTFRKYNGEYRVWQGSDFDLDAALQEQRDQLGRIELAKLLNEREVIAPVVARRHAIETGTLRYFRTQFADTLSAVEALKIKVPTVLLCLAENRDSEDMFAQASLRHATTSQLIIAVVPNASTIRKVVTEVISYERVQRQYPEVNSDPVATRELKDRLSIAKELEHELLAAVVEEPESSSWWWCGAKDQSSSKRGLQDLLSRALEKTFEQSPHIHNELINRDKPSSTANAARKKLLMAMLDHGDKFDLGFEKFPAEKAMYRALLHVTGIHAQVEGEWKFQAPRESARGRLLPLWRAIEAYLDAEPNQPRTLADLFDHLSQPPFGMKQGVLPVLLLAFYLANEEELALFDDGQYCPFISQENIERIIKEPQVFGLQRFRPDPVRDTIFRAYIESVSLMGDAPAQVNLIAAARPFARFMMTLPDYAKVTKSISVEAQQLREKFYAAKSPLQLLFFQIPDALGLKPLVGDALTPDNLDTFGRRLKRTIAELRVAYHALLNDFTDQLRTAFKLSGNESLERIREILTGRYTGLQDYTIDVQGLKAFIGRITDAYGDEKHWLISLASFLARKPPEKWTDDDASAAHYRLLEIAKKLRELETLRLHSERTNDKCTEYELILVKSISQTNGETELVVTLDPEKRERLKKLVGEIEKRLDGLGSDDLKNAALAMLIAPDATAAKSEATVQQQGAKSNG
jgi:hypothetical protein